jgi:hypothetical protein
MKHGHQRKVEIWGHGESGSQKLIIVHHLSRTERRLQKFENQPLLAYSVRYVEVLSLINSIVAFFGEIRLLRGHKWVGQLVLHYLSLNYFIFLFIIGGDLDAFWLRTLLWDTQAKFFVSASVSFWKERKYDSGIFSCYLPVIVEIVTIILIWHQIFDKISESY